jgi:prepilin-type N-terminal cleavage/methylation domain-containing protein
MKRRGFTIIELMVATMVFSLVLLLCLTALMSISRSYYKGVTLTKVQNATRQIVNEISQGIQLSADSIMASTGPAGPMVDPSADPTGIMCVGLKRYTYAIDRQIATNPSVNAADKQIKNAVIRDQLAAPCSSTTPKANLGVDVTAPSASLLSENMRLSRLIVEPVGGDQRIWRVSVTVVFGSSDLLVEENGRTVCRSDVGKEFCGFSEISTTVIRRMGNE